MLPAEAPHAYSFAVLSRIVFYGSMWVILGHSAVVAKKSGKHVPGLEHGTLSWYAQPLAHRLPTPQKREGRIKLWEVENTHSSLGYNQSTTPHPISN